MTLEEKYRRAVQTLQAIAQCTGSQKYRGGYLHDEWTEADAFNGCTNAAIAALECIGEPTYLPDRKPRHEAEAKLNHKEPYFPPEPEKSISDLVDEMNRGPHCPCCGRSARPLLGSYVFCDKCGAHILE